MGKPITILGFAGSLRKGSYNKAILRAAAELVPEDTRLEIFDLEGIPPFNMDLETAMPEKVKQFKAAIKSADAVLLVTPEHNYSIPGVLKNAIDWASRPLGDNSFEGKPAAIMSASTGIFGGARAQYHLRQVLVFLNMFPLNKPEMFVASADKKIDSAGKVIDEETRKRIAGLIKALADWTRKLNP
jgi:chromate reductase, NAD(P)H dehydrogenase (quinone)